MQPKCSHEENRAKVCGPCGKKIVLGKMRAATRISGAHETLIRKLISDDFNLLDSKFPLSICTTCRLTIIEHSQNRTSRPLPQMPNYQDMIFLATRSNDGTCNCYICLTARSAVHLKNVEGRGSEREFNIRIDVSNGLFGRSSLTSLPRNKKTIEKAQNRSTTCTICRGEIRKGIRHSCGSGSVVDNSVQAIDALSEAQKQRVISKLLKRQINKVTDNEGTSSSNNQNCEVRLKTGGPEMRVVVKPKKMKMFTFDSKSLDDFRISTGVSFNHMIKMTSFIRRTTGKNSIPSHYRERMSEQSKILDSHYKSKVLEFDVETTPVMIRKQRPVVYVDAEELLEFVLESRNMIGDFNIKVFTDSGQGSLKMSMSIFPSSETNANDTDDINLESSRSSRKNKSELTGVHKLLLIAIVPSVKETYENLRLLFDLTNINNLPYKFLADFKVYHLVNGQQTSRASFPCPYCFISLNDLKDIESVPDKQDNRFHGAAKSSAPYYDLESSAEAQDIENEELNGVLRSWKLYDDLENITPDDSEIVVLNSNKENECEENTLRPVKSLRSYGDLKKDYEKFLSLGGNKKLAKQSHNTVNLPLFDENNEVLVLQKCIIPVLHIMLGFVNHVIFNGLVPLLGREKALLWPMKLNLISKHYQGEMFEGNACRKLLKEADKLMDPEIYDGIEKLRLVPFIATLKSMDKIVSNYFTSKKVSSVAELPKQLDELRTNFASTGLSQTLKIHVLLDHLSDSLSILNNDGLGLWSEQAGESMHREFLIHWNRYRVNSISCDSYIEQFRKAVVEFSSLHL